MPTQRGCTIVAKTVLCTAVSWLLRAACPTALLVLFFFRFCVEYMLSCVTSAGQFVVQTGLNPVLAVSGMDVEWTKNGCGFGRCGFEPNRVLDSV